MVSLEQLCLTISSGIIAAAVLLLSIETLVARRTSLVDLPGNWQLDSILAFFSFFSLLGACLGWISPLLSGPLFIAFAIRNLRVRLARQAGDTMILTVLAAVFFGSVGDTLTIRVCLYFILAQASLAYFNNGLSKLKSPKWRTGDFFYELFRYSGFQNPLLARCFRPGRFSFAATWAVIAFELLFPLAVISGIPGVFLFIGFGVLFHLFIALAMGLGSFSLGFLATYPALYYCSVQVAGIFALQAK